MYSRTPLDKLGTRDIRIRRKNPDNWIFLLK
jgi:hypothetical protein